MRPIETPFEAMKAQVREICKGKEVKFSSTEVLDRFRDIHRHSKTGTKNLSRGTVGQSWTKVDKSRGKPSNDRHLETGEETGAPQAPASS